MNNDIRRTIGGVAVLMLLICVALFFGIRRAEKPGGTAPSPPPVETDGLMMKDDLLPPAGSYYRQWEFALLDGNGRTVRLADFRGEPLALMYFASWCPDCRAVDIAAVAEAARGAGARFELVVREGVRGETAETIRAYLADRGIPLRALLDEGAAAYAEIGLHWVPSVLYFDAEGVLMYAETEKVTPGAVTAGVMYAREGGRPATEAFLRALAGKEGRIAPNFEVEGRGIVPGGGALSETQGMMMLYAATSGDRPLFDAAYGYIEAYTREGVTPWRIENGAAADGNATLDDLRILEALMAARARWGGYGGDIEERAAALLACAPEGKLVDFIGSGTLTLCYADVATLGALSEVDAAFDGIARGALERLEGGYIGDDFPLYRARYDYKTGRYTDENLQMNEAMVAVYHLARAGRLKSQTRDWLADTLARGPIYAAYTVDGEVIPGFAYESTATYALIAMTGCALGDGELIRAALYRMERARVMDAQSPLNGGYADGVENFTFDSMAALLAWERMGIDGKLSYLAK